MSSDDWIQYISIGITCGALILNRHGMKHYVPAALFAALYAHTACMVAMDGFHLWSFPERLIGLSEHPVTFNMIIVPIIVMFWLRYCPSSLIGIIFWILSWSALLSGIELIFENYTNLIKYHNGYNVIITFFLWVITFPLFLAFHHWLNNTEPIFNKQKRGWR